LRRLIRRAGRQMQLIAGEMTAKGKTLRLFQTLAMPKPLLARPPYWRATNSADCHVYHLSKNVN
jgi:hypothetical protein